MAVWLEFVIRRFFGRGSPDGTSVEWPGADPVSTVFVRGWTLTFRWDGGFLDVGVVCTVDGLVFERKGSLQ